MLISSTGVGIAVTGRGRPVPKGANQTHRDYSQVVAERLYRQVLALNVQIQNRRWSIEDTGALVDLSVLELTGIPVTPGARYQYGRKDGGKDEATVREERGDVGIV